MVSSAIFPPQKNVVAFRDYSGGILGRSCQPLVCLGDSYCGFGTVYLVPSRGFLLQRVLEE
jgi:hypothetical protein